MAETNFKDIKLKKSSKFKCLIIFSSTYHLVAQLVTNFIRTNIRLFQHPQALLQTAWVVEAESLMLVHSLPVDELKILSIHSMEIRQETTVSCNKIIQCLEIFVTILIMTQEILETCLNQWLLLPIKIRTNFIIKTVKL